MQIIVVKNVLKKIDQFMKKNAIIFQEDVLEVSEVILVEWS